MAASKPIRTCRVRSHDEIMADLNPEGWTTERWRAFLVRLSADAVYRASVESARRRRVCWVDDELSRMFGRRSVSAKLRLKQRRELMQTARVEIPNPDPLDGWTPPLNFKVGAALEKRMTMKPNESVSGLAAVRAVVAEREGQR